MAESDHRIAGSLLVLMLMSSLACATNRPVEYDETTLVPRGPGIVFQSVEAAAIDALAYAHELAEREGDAGRMAGGTIHVVEGGFTYDGVETANAATPATLQLRLTGRDVARFHLYPRVESFGVNRMNERPSRTDRRSGDVVDPVHRPLFVLTPRLSVIAYRGDHGPSVEIADLREAKNEGSLADE